MRKLTTETEEKVLAFVPRKGVKSYLLCAFDVGRVCGFKCSALHLEGCTVSCARLSMLGPEGCIGVVVSNLGWLKEIEE